MDELLFKYFRGEATPEEKQAIGDWLEADPVEHAKQYKSAHFIYEGNILYRNDKPASTPPLRSNILRIVARYAAGIAAVLLLAVGAKYWGQKQTFDRFTGQMTVLEIPAGQRIKVALPDGSQVWLNSMTRLEYPAVFQKNERRVKLSGEAMFEVAHNAEQPFVVETFATNVEVLGTKFNVVAEEKDRRFSTLLLQGSVKVVNRLKSQPAIILKPNETVNLIGERLCVESTSDTSSLCWLDGQVSISKQSFGELMSKFEKAFGVKIVVGTRQMPAVDFSRGKVRVSDGIDHALKVLQHGSDFTYTKDEANNTILIQ